ncbi:MAG: CDP-diacylglycerol--glycerol-3-phosphate 3-phosphatidyltransferase [Gammaproteobacteria bacterium]|nr:MAG: CDP-diacylglycerol--glycerol-3-phosphate 3-phosphatidyltransferase [Gammaproteobacteria bacterium]RLA24623.1 MAG: CDP-diacylglycerol--glycerol-3-phosphate 3-phosphatidyltransferase [Gammaproteobacteria bacterium]
MRFNLPTTLTLLRIVLIPVLVLFCYLPVDWSNIACVVIFSIAALTDWLDGYLARRWQQMTAFGAFLDPVADKLMVAVALVLIVQNDPSPSLAIASAVIIGREITITSLREWMAELGERAKIKVSWLGKVKTTFQMLAIVVLLYGSDYENIPLRDIGYLLLFVAAVLTLWSMISYLRAALPLLKRGL